MALEAVRVAAAVPVLVLVADDRGDAGEVLRAGQDALARDRVLGHDGPLVRRQRALLAEQLGGHRELADVVQERAVGDPLDVVVGQAEHHRDAAARAARPRSECSRV